MLESGVGKDVKTGLFMARIDVVEQYLTVLTVLSKLAYSAP